jgi:hypothetical protein
MDDQVTWLRAVLDDVEAAVLRLRDGHDGPCVNYEGQDPANYDDYDSCSRHIAVAQASPYSDAAFGLRDIAAKRAIVDLHAVEVERVFMNPVDGPGYHEDEFSCRICGWFDSGTGCETIRHLAAAYADHDGYREEWKP